MSTVEQYQVSVTPAELEHFRTEGFHIQRKLFSPQEVQTLREYFDRMAEKPDPATGWMPDMTEAGQKDPLLRYPRVMFPHRNSPMCQRMLLHPGVHDVLVQLLGDEPIAAQSMYYFKPPGSRGQALHQDNFYLAVKPFSCIAAWTAIDPAIPENGGLYVVPDTHNYPVVCPKEADPNESFFQHFVPPPEGKKAIPARLEPGDTLFFNGNVIHGSGPNRHETLWRRSYICHYLPSKAAYLAGMYNPCLRFDGTSLEVAANPDGGPCGKEWEGKLPYVA